MTVVLVRKLADWIDGIDLSSFRVGDVLDLPHATARLLAAEGWVLVDRRRPLRTSHTQVPARRASDRQELCGP